MSQKSKTFRLFLSSTFNDMRAERDKLQADVFPKLRSYCEEHGFSFQPIDLRWGVSNEAGFDQKTMQICIDEVKRCKDALNPHFAIMLGERYGWIPLPAQVEAEEFEKVKAAVERRFSDDTTTLNYLQLWYDKDTNAIPPHYRLQPRLEEQEKQSAYWIDVEAKLRTAFRTVVIEDLKNTLTEAEQFKYLKSATEQEIIEGLFNNHTIAKENIYFYNREFKKKDDLTTEEFAKLDDVKHFFDFRGDTENQLDTEMRSHHHALINKIRAELPSHNVKTYKLQLDPSLKRTQDSVTEAYLEQFAADFEKTILDSIEKEINTFKSVAKQESQDHELAIQQNFLNEKVKIFVGRDVLINQVANYLSTKNSNAPLVITADSGSGKSALMAKVIQKTLSQSIQSTKTLYRFVGISEQSNSPINLYQSLHRQLIQDRALKVLNDKYIADNQLPPEQVLSDFKELNKLIAHLLGNYPKNQQLNLFIDALDQFIIQDPLDWLPRELQNNTKIILTTLPNSESYKDVKYLPKLKQKYKQEENYLYLGKFQVAEASVMIDEYLKTQHRTITAPQKQILLDAFSQSGSPLYLKILLEEAREWNSYTDVTKEIYPAELDALIARLFSRLHSHSHHRLPLIKYVFAYLACSKDGLPEPEFFDILSQEKTVMDDVSNEFYPRPNRLPTAVWARLYSQIAHYLSTKEVDGMNQIRFFHRKFNEGAYHLLGNRETAHTNLANFYEKVYEKTLMVETSVESALAELPYQLVMSAQKHKSLQLLTNFDFLMQKLKLNKIKEILEDYELAKAMGMHGGEETNEALKEQFFIFDNFFTANKHILERGVEGWESSKIFFQLSIEHGDESPLTDAAEQYERDGKVSWDYLRDINRRMKYIINPLQNVLRVNFDIQGIEIVNDEMLVFTKNATIIYDAENFQQKNSIDTAKKFIKASNNELTTVNSHKNYYALKNGDLFCYGDLTDVDVIVRDAKTLEKKEIIKGHGGGPLYLQENSNGDIATISYQRAFRILRDYKELYKLAELHNDNILGFYFNDENDNLITWSDDKTIKKWKLDLSRNPLEQANLKNIAVCLDHDDYVFTGGAAINKLSKQNYKIIGSNSEHGLAVSIAKISEKCIACSFFDGFIKIFDVNSLKLIKTLDFKEKFPLMYVAAIDENLLIYAPYGNTAYLLDKNLNVQIVNKENYKDYIKYSSQDYKKIKSEMLEYKKAYWHSDKEKNIIFIDEEKHVICIKDGKISIKFLKYINKP